MSGLATFPTVTWEFAPASDPTDPAPTWVDITPYVRPGRSISRGRNSESDQIGTGMAKVRLRNSDGRFDPANGSSPYAGGLLPLRPIRCRATWDGVTYDRFRGLVLEWPQEWSKGGRYSEVDITCVDVLRVLAAFEFGPAYDELVESLGAAFHHDFATGGTAADPLPGGTTDARGRRMLGYNTGVPVGALPFYEYLAESSGGYGSGSAGHGVWFDIVSADALATHADFWLLDFQDNLGSHHLGIGFEHSATASSGYRLVVKNTPTGVRTTGPDVTSGRHHFGALFTGTGSVEIYIDGTLALTAPVTNSWAKWGVFAVDDGSNTTGLIVDVDEVTRYTAMTASIVASEVEAGTDPGAFGSLPAQIASDRVEDLLDIAGWPSALRDIQTSSIGLAGTGSLNGQNALSVLQQTAEYELGAAYTDGAGQLVFQNRAHRESPGAPAFVFGDESGELPYLDDIRFTHDDKRILNDITVAPGGGVTQARVTDATSINRFFRRRKTYAYPYTSSSDVSDTAALLLARLKDPQERLDRITLNPAAHPALWPAALSLDVGTFVEVRRRPPGAPLKTFTGFVEQISERQGLDSHLLEVTLSPAP